MVMAPPEGATTVDLLRWVFDRLNEHDIASLRRFWTPQTVECFPDATCRGADEVARYFEDKFAAIEGFHLEVVAIAVEGSDAMVHWRMDGIDHFVLEGATVVSNTVVFDQMAFARQVGLLPADRTAADRALKAVFNARTRLVGAARRRMNR